jgi:cyclase
MTDDRWEGRRVIPTLLIDGRRTIKTKRYGRRARYLGDLVNLLRIFTEKQVDEIIVVDRGAARAGIDYEFLAAASSECFAPLAYGGGVRSAEDAARVVAAGIDKVMVTTAATDEGVLREMAAALGSQAVIAGSDVGRTRSGRRHLLVDGGARTSPGDPAAAAARYVAAGAGEVFVNATWREGTRRGYDLRLLTSVVDAADVPVTICGGAGSVEDIRAAFERGASGAAAGTMFVFFGPFEAVLPTYARPNG